MKTSPMRRRPVTTDQAVRQLEAAIRRLGRAILLELERFRAIFRG